MVYGTDDKYLFHLLDTPGHAEYSAELAIAVPLADGAVIGVVQSVSRAGFSGETGQGIASTGYSCLAAPTDALSEWLGLVNQD